MANFVVKKSLIETLRTMQIGESMRIKRREFKVTAVRTAKDRLKKEGIFVKVSEAGMIDECEVTRLR